jgi:hypothetical protein
MADIVCMQFVAYLLCFLSLIPLESWHTFILDTTKLNVSIRHQIFKVIISKSRVKEIYAA